MDGYPVHFVDLRGKQFHPGERVDQVVDHVDVGTEDVSQAETADGSKHRDQQAVEHEDRGHSPGSRSR